MSVDIVSFLLNCNIIVIHLAHYERLFKNAQSFVHEEAVSGLLLIYPQHIVHVLEVSTKF